MKEEEIKKGVWYKIKVNNKSIQYWFKPHEDRKANNSLLHFADVESNFPRGNGNLSQDNSSFKGSDYEEVIGNELLWVEECVKRGTYFPQKEFIVPEPKLSLLF